MEKNAIKVVEKPKIDDFKLEVKVEGITKLENNMEVLKNMASTLKTFYKNNPFIEKGIVIDFEDKEQMKKIEEKKKDAATEKATINKLKTAISEKVKEAITEYKKPITPFEDLSKETKEILSETYNIINEQVISIDEQVKEEKRKKMEDFFNETAKSKGIDFVKYDDMIQNITLSARVKSLKAEINCYIAGIEEDLKLIDTEEYKAEILAEYKTTLDVSKSILNVRTRVKAIEEEKQRLEELEIKKQEEVKVVEKVEEVVAPIVVGIDHSESDSVCVEQVEKIFTMSFTVTGTKDQLRAIKEFLDNLKEEGVNYGSK